MKAAILAAGIGSRLRPITSQKPKCMVTVAGQPILGHQIRAYVCAGITEIVIVVGYEAQKIKDYCKHIKDANITFIENQDYETTNNMYSLYLAGNKLAGNSFILSNADVVFDPEIAYDLLHNKTEDLIAVDLDSYLAESMKITVNQSGYIDDISKIITKENTYGTSIDVYKFSAQSSITLFEDMRKTIEKEGNLKDWTEVTIQRLLRTNDFKMRPFDIGQKNWVEIDNYKDLSIADKRFSSFDLNLSAKKLFFIDLDGTVYIGNTIITGGKEFLVKLKSLQITYYFLSNNSSCAKKDYVEKLHKMGIDIAEDNIILSSDGLIEYLLDKKVNDIFLVGTESMARSIANVGINTQADNPEYVVLGYDTELTYEKLRKAAIYLGNGADLLATHCDIVCPTAEGPIPDIGSVLALIETATGKKPLKIFGKPNPEMIQHVINRHKATAKEVVVVGDRLYTDMELAKQVGCSFICVLSGETKREHLEDLDNVPDLIVNSIGEIC